MKQLEFQEVTFRYPGQEKEVLDHISFQIEQGEFIVLCGPSGCGKSTLLRHMQKSQIPFGTGSGKMFFQGMDLETMADREAASKIGFVGQSPENQIVTDTVWHELAFGPESLGWSSAEIRIRTAELAEYFGMSGWFRKKTTALSGGQKQILNLASVMIMRPELLILDEPTSQLDPIAAERFIQTLVKLHRDFGMTIILSEQRLESVLPEADRVIMMQEGSLLGIVHPAEAGQCLKRAGSPVYQALPASVRIYLDSQDHLENLKYQCPLTVQEGKQWFREQMRCSQGRANEDLQVRDEISKSERIVLEAKHIRYSYPGGIPVLRDFNWKLPAGSMYAVLGGNGSGKTTVLKLMGGIYQPEEGKCKATGTVIYLPQNPKTVFTEISVEEELAELLLRRKQSLETIRKKVENQLALMELEGVRRQHPYDLSGGQQQRLALAKVLLLEPDILLLDEPTKGLDAALKQRLAEYLKMLCANGVTVVMVSHDIEFCAEYATHCGLLFDGEMISCGTTREFFGKNYFYNTAAARIAAELVPEVLTCEDAVRVVSGETGRKEKR